MSSIKLSLLITCMLSVGLQGISIAQQKKPETEEKSSKPDSSLKQLEEELARELGEVEDSESGVSGRTSAARQSFFQNMNPNISVIGTVLGTANSMETVDRNVDLSFEEGEFSFQAAVDPYAKADFYAAFGKHAESTLVPEGEEHEGEEHEEEERGHEEGGLTPELEEAYLTLLSLPFSTQLKAGKFRSMFGKINVVHPHANDFIDMPLMYTNFFGPEGLSDEGMSLSWLLPNTAFYQNLTFEVTGGPGENASFSRAENNHLLYLAHLKNFFDLNDNTTMELGFTGVTGPHNEAGDNTQVLAADLTLKWKPLRRNRYKSFELMSEVLMSRFKGETGTITSYGLYAFLRYQVARRWYLGGMFDYSEYPQFNDFNHKAYSGIFQFFATEFQKFELQLKYNDGNFFENFAEAKLRAVFVIGAHGAHQY